MITDLLIATNKINVKNRSNINPHFTAYNVPTLSYFKCISFCIWYLHNIVTPNIEMM